MDYGGFGESVGADEFVVRRVISHIDDTDLASDALGAPGEIAGVKAKGTEFAVAAADADDMDALRANTGVRGLSTFLKSSVVVVKSRCRS